MSGTFSVIAVLTSLVIVLRHVICLTSGTWVTSSLRRIWIHVMHGSNRRKATWRSTWRHTDVTSIYNSATTRTLTFRRHYVICDLWRHYSFLILFVKFVIRISHRWRHPHTPDVGEMTWRNTITTVLHTLNDAEMPDIWVYLMTSFYYF